MTSKKVEAKGYPDNDIFGIRQRATEEVVFPK